jgi:hypothetical protein
MSTDTRLVHTARPKAAKDRFSKSQLTLEGSTITEEQRRDALLQVPNLPTRCPFCLQAQTVRQMCFFLANGKLSMMRRCVNSRCNKQMQASSAVVFMRGAEEYGKWVATYPRFWQSINHEKFMEALQSLKDLGKLDVFEFWRAYREIRPKPKLDKDGYPIRDSTGQMVYETPSGKQASDPRTIDTASIRDYEFVRKEDGQKWTLRGDELTEDDDYWFVHMGATMQQKVSKKVWDLPE